MNDQRCTRQSYLYASLQLSLSDMDRAKSVGIDGDESAACCDVISLWAAIDEGSRTRACCRPSASGTPVANPTKPISKHAARGAQTSRRAHPGSVRTTAPHADRWAEAIELADTSRDAHEEIVAAKPCAIPLESEGRHHRKSDSRVALPRPTLDWITNLKHYWQRPLLGARPPIAYLLLFSQRETPSACLAGQCTMMQLGWLALNGDVG